jgi:hypothetical protein
MHVIFSRKGFDSGSGGVPSPIIGGQPISLPIPASGKSVTSYADLGLGDIVERSTRGRIRADHLCHEDPMFSNGRCLFGQCGASQSHLENNGVGPGDLFLFFGLFADELTGERHHRLFGWLRLETVVAGPALKAHHPLFAEAPRPHPHTIGERPANNCIYAGPGMLAATADPRLRLTCKDGPLRLWDVPRWLPGSGLTYHSKPERWHEGNQLEIVSRGQEFVTDIGDREEPRRWLDKIMEVIAT